MNPKRKRRLYMVVFLLVTMSGTTAALMLALEQNINMFYPPEEVVSGVAPVNVPIRAGGMVAEGSVQRSLDSLAVRFVLTDHQGADFEVMYDGILPDLFREGQGILVQGELQADGNFVAREVLAKHDENYMPPELLDMHADASDGAD
ncbi:MAG: cytochrome c maturation protein CcmE [Pseudomonadota bacterium]